MENSKNSIAIVICFMGPMPWYFKIFLKTCAANPDVHFIMVSDRDYTEPLPDNFRWITMSMPELKKLIDAKTGLNVSLSYAYKLCDIKPAYGVVFEEYLEGYTFWGHYDIDIVFGRIRHFITEEILEQNDVISVMPEYVTGCFALYRNNNYINRLYEQSKDHKMVFESDKHYCFDECNHLFNYLKGGRSIFDLNFEVDSMTHVVRKLQRDGKVRAYFNRFIVEAKPGRMEWNNGVLTIFRKYEILMYHMFEFKRLKHYYLSFGDKIPDKFYIGRFYMSEKPYWTTGGKLYRLKCLLNLRRKLFARMLKNVFNSTARVRRTEFANPEEFIGRYGSIVPTKLYTDITLENNRLRIQLPRKKSLTLYHIKNNRFFCLKWGIEIEFGYSQLLKKKCIHGISLYNENQSEEYLY